MNLCCRLPANGTFYIEQQSERKNDPSGYCQGRRRQGDGVYVDWSEQLSTVPQSQIKKESRFSGYMLLSM
jgi:hypothetical protein